MGPRSPGPIQNMGEAGGNRSILSHRTSPLRHIGAAENGRGRFFWRNTDDDGVLDLESLQDMRYFPPQSFPSRRENLEETFIWTDVHYDPESNLLAVSGCYWACPYSVIVLDFSEPMTEQPVEYWLDVRSIIDPNYELYDDIDFDRWENGALYLKGEGKPEEIRMTVKQLREALKDLI